MSTLKYVSTLGTGWQKSTISNGGSGYTSGATSIVVAAGGNFPSSGDFWVGVGDTNGLPHFIKRCTARSGNTLTVDAAVVAGTDQNEPDGTVVQWVLSPEALDQLRADLHGYGTFASRPATCKKGDFYHTSDSIYESLATATDTWTDFYLGQRISVPPSTGWTNSGFTSSTIDTTAGLHLINTAASEDPIRYRTAPSPPYTITAKFLVTIKTNTTTGRFLKLGFRKSTTGDLWMIAVTKWGDANRLDIHKIIGGTPTDVQIGTNQGDGPTLFLYITLQISDDNTDRIYRYSMDGGRNWIAYYTHGRTVDFTADEVFWGAGASAGSQTYVSLIGWDVQ